MSYTSSRVAYAVFSFFLFLVILSRSECISLILPKSIVQSKEIKEGFRRTSIGYVKRKHGFALFYLSVTIGLIGVR